MIGNKSFGNKNQPCFSQSVRMMPDKKANKK